MGSQIEDQLAEAKIMYVMLRDPETEDPYNEKLSRIEMVSVMKLAAAMREEREDV